MAFICVIKDEPIAAIWAGLFAIILLIVLYFMVNDNYYSDFDDGIYGTSTDGITPTVVYDVINFSVDTNIVVNDMDTIKTYTLTYFKED